MLYGLVVYWFSSLVVFLLTSHLNLFNKDGVVTDNLDDTDF